MSSIATRPVKSEAKWENIFNSSTSENEWGYIYCHANKTTSETKLKALQFKLLHRILPCNEWLFKNNLVNSSSCSFCNYQTESLQHLFWDCHIVKSIWLQLFECLKNLNIINDNKTFLSCKKLIQGCPSNPLNIEHIILMTKEYIYSSKLSGNEPNIEPLLQMIKYKIKLEKQYMNRQKFNMKWGNEILSYFSLKDD